MLQIETVKNFKSTFTDANGCEVNIYSSIHDVPKGEWATCVKPDNLFLTENYLKTVEESQLPGLQTRYAVIKYHANSRAVLYFQIVNLSDKGLGGILNLDEYGGLASSLSSRINDLLFSPGGDKTSYLMVCGNLLVSGDHGVAATDKEAFAKALQCITAAKKIIGQSLGSHARLVAFMAKDFYEDKNVQAAPILKKDYFLLNTDPEMIFTVNPEWNNFDDYLAALSSKYRIRANNVKAKLGTVQIKDLSLDEIIEKEQELFLLNDQVIRKAPVKLIRPSPSYFTNLKRNFGDHYNIKAFLLGGQIIAFTSALWNEHHYEAHYIGIDYAYNAEYSLYQNILYSYINDAIFARSSKLFYGRTALEIKSTVGAKPNQLYCYFRFANRVINTLARPLVSSTGPQNWIPRDPFKK